MKNLLLVLFVSVLSFCVNAQNSDFGTIPHIAVNGHSEMEVEPNQFYLGITIREDSKSSRKIDVLEQKMRTELSSIGINVSKQLKVQNYYSNYHEYWMKKNQNLASKSYELLVNDPKKLDAIFSRLGKVGINNIYVKKVDHSEIEKFKLQVKTKAIQNAKKEAGVLVRAIGNTLGKPLSINPQGNYHYPRPMYSKKAMRSEVMADAAVRSAPALEYKAIKLKYNVQTVFEIK